VIDQILLFPLNHPLLFGIFWFGSMIATGGWAVWSIRRPPRRSLSFVSDTNGLRLGAITAMEEAGWQAWVDGRYADETELVLDAILDHLDARAAEWEIAASKVAGAPVFDAHLLIAALRKDAP